MPDRNLNFRDLAQLDAEERAALAGSLAAVRTLEDLLAWGRRQHPPTHVDEIVTQDEFTHDVLVRLEPPRWLAFDVT